MIQIILVVHIILAIALVAVILLQRSRAVRWASEAERWAG